MYTRVYMCIYVYTHIYVYIYVVPVQDGLLGGHSGFLIKNN